MFYQIQAIIRLPTREAADKALIELSALIARHTDTKQNQLTAWPSSATLHKCTHDSANPLPCAILYSTAVQPPLPTGTAEEPA